ncbi:unnamed protein product [marine sediment metagenome]|uniref:Uncharacterized protein n=1 Tax=marine sediment metagenome TaxID=412755 RepID=X0UAS2_9ZZZZ
MILDINDLGEGSYRFNLLGNSAGKSDPDSEPIVNRENITTE